MPAGPRGQKHPVDVMPKAMRISTAKTHKMVKLPTGAHKSDAPARPCLLQNVAENAGRGRQRSCSREVGMMLKKTEIILPKDIAGWFVNASERDSGDVPTHLKIQKLVYYAQAWYLANFDRPLFAEDMQAWSHGPVAPSVYEKYRGRGFGALPFEKNIRVPESVVPFLQAVYDEYGQYTAKRLERMTHEELPWKATRGNLPLEVRCTKPIDKLLIRNYYGARIGKKKVTEI